MIPSTLHLAIIESLLVRGIQVVRQSILAHESLVRVDIALSEALLSRGSLGQSLGLGRHRAEEGHSSRCRRGWQGAVSISPNAKSRSASNFRLGEASTLWSSVSDGVASWTSSALCTWLSGDVAAMPPLPPGVRCQKPRGVESNIFIESGRRHFGRSAADLLLDRGVVQRIIVHGRLVVISGRHLTIIPSGSMSTLLSGAGCGGTISATRSRRVFRLGSARLPRSLGLSG